ncbi:hypothetical protein HUA74_10795 [Myxococcus sp. CA051A]|nr:MULTISPECIES: hypothetical protein [Myxococcus]NTX52343.1 hypothetical protein [Myxococcus sp. CA039A]NTX61151.1 hypothetical protein [Myxococcus sp. CA051A]
MAIWALRIGEALAVRAIERASARIEEATQWWIAPNACAAVSMVGLEP